MPRWVNRAANATSSTILARPNRVFSSSTHVPPRNPVSTPSWSVKTAQTTTQPAKSTPVTGLPSSE